MAAQTTHQRSGIQQEKLGEAVETCYLRQIGERGGWRLPTIEELASLFDDDPEFYDPERGRGRFDALKGSRLPERGRVFQLGRDEPQAGEEPVRIWSITTAPDDGNEAYVIKWGVITVVGTASYRFIATRPKRETAEVWCVRAGTGHDPNPAPARLE